MNRIFTRDNGTKYGVANITTRGMYSVTHYPSIHTQINIYITNKEEAEEMISQFAEAQNLAKEILEEFKNV